MRPPILLEEDKREVRKTDTFDRLDVLQSIRFVGACLQKERNGLTIVGKLWGRANKDWDAFRIQRKITCTRTSVFRGGRIFQQSGANLEQNETEQPIKTVAYSNPNKLLQGTNADTILFCSFPCASLARNKCWPISLVAISLRPASDPQPPQKRRCHVITHDSPPEDRETSHAERNAPQDES